MDSLNQAMAAPALTRLFLVRVYLASNHALRFVAIAGYRGPPMEDRPWLEKVCTCLRISSNLSGGGQEQWPVRRDSI